MFSQGRCTQLQFLARNPSGLFVFQGWYRAFCFWMRILHCGEVRMVMKPRQSTLGERFEVVSIHPFEVVRSPPSNSAW